MLAKSVLFLWCVTCAVSISFEAAAQQVYQWRDAAGVTHFSDRPANAVPAFHRRAKKLPVETHKLSIVFGNSIASPRRLKTPRSRLTRPYGMPPTSSSLNAGPTLQEPDNPLSTPELDNLMQVPGQSSRGGRVQRPRSRRTRSTTMN